MSINPVWSILINSEVVFWDFDGVIKDSVEVKSEAFKRLFKPFGDQVVKKVREHHETNGGMSRFDKIPLYLRWANSSHSESVVLDYCERFSSFVMQGVIDSPWVPGAKEYLHSNQYQQTNILVSATPQDELEKILGAIDLSACFANIFGFPTYKKDAIRMTLDTYGVDAQKCLMIGDALADYEAAHSNNVPFLLRRHATNSLVFSNYDGPDFRSFDLL